MSAQPSSIEQIRQRLLNRRNELANRHQRVESDLGRQNEPLVADFSDQATQRQNDETLEAIGDTARSEIAAIDAALIRLEAGQYGDCVSCGRPIEAARLQAVPYATTCVNCAHE